MLLTTLFEYLLVGLIVGLAAVFLVSRVVPRRRKTCGGKDGSCNCG